MGRTLFHRGELCNDFTLLCHDVNSQNVIVDNCDVTVM
jgi:hypothetical protein